VPPMYSPLLLALRWAQRWGLPDTARYVILHDLDPHILIKRRLMTWRALAAWPYPCQTLMS